MSDRQNVASLNSFGGIFHHKECKTFAGACSKVGHGKRKVGSEIEIGLVFGKERSHSNLGMATASGSGYPSQGERNTY